jgi:hypothetical protein
MGNTFVYFVQEKMVYIFLTTKTTNLFTSILIHVIKKVTVEYFQNQVYLN